MIPVPDSEQQLLAAGVERLEEALGDGFETAPYNTGNEAKPRPDAPVDAMITVRDKSTGTSTVLLIEAKDGLSPAGVRRYISPRWDLLARLPGHVTPLVIASWLSPRTREELDRAGYGYLDLTGNVSLDIPQPRVRLLLQGAGRDPAPRGTGARGLAGAAAGRLVRLLVDVAPPYRASGLAERSGLSLPYVSRLLGVMEDRGLIERSGRVVDTVDWAGLIRERAGQTNLLRANPPVAMVAPQGQHRVLDRLRDQPELAGTVAVTGSAAAGVVAPLTAGGQLMIYLPGDVDAPDQVGRQLGLLRGDRGADVLLLRASNPVVFERTRLVDRIRHVALSQLAIDCLSGSGRMPAEGEAVLEYMAGGDKGWRLPSLDAA